MKMDIVANSGNDEFYTPEYAITPLVKYLDKTKRVWCPFDTERSNFVKVLRFDNNMQVNVTHKDVEDSDFFHTEDITCDYIISNPPYSLKFEVFERLFKIGKPFAMLVGVVGLFESKKRFNLFKDNNFEVMYFDKRIAYFKSYDEQKPSLNPPFSSVYITKGILPNRIVFETIEK